MSEEIDCELSEDDNASPVWVMDDKENRRAVEQARLEYYQAGTRFFRIARVYFVVILILLAFGAFGLFISALNQMQQS